MVVGRQQSDSGCGIGGGCMSGDHGGSVRKLGRSALCSLLDGEIKPNHESRC